MKQRASYFVFEFKVIIYSIIVITRKIVFDTVKPNSNYMSHFLHCVDGNKQRPIGDILVDLMILLKRNLETLRDVDWI